MQEARLRVLEVAKIAQCSRSTVLNYERDGYIQSYRDFNGHRRFTEGDAERLRMRLNARWPSRRPFAASDMGENTVECNA